MILRTLLLLLLFCGAAEAQTAQTMDALSSGAPLGATDILAECTGGASCGTLKKITGADLSTFLQSAAIVSCANNASTDPTTLSTAVATGKNVFIQSGTCNFTTATVGIVGTTPGQKIRGSGYGTLINVGTNTSIATGLFQCTTGGGTPINGSAYNNVGTIWSDMRIVFTQVQTATRASLRNFSPAFYVQGCYKPTFERLRIEECMVCFDLRGTNSGDAVFRDIEMSPISAGIWIDNGQAPVTLDRLYVEPYGAELYGSGNCNPPATAATLCALFFTINAASPETTSGVDGPIGIYAQFMQGCYISNSLFFIGQGAVFDAGSGGSANCSITNTGWDSGSGITVKGASQIRQSGGYFGSQGIVTNAQAVVIPTGTTAEFNCVGCTFYGGASPTTVAASSGIMSITGGVLDGQAGNLPIIECEGTSVCSITGNSVAHTIGAATTGIIMMNFAAATTAKGNISNNVATSTLVNPLVWVGNDADIRVLGNVANGGTNRCPGTQTTMKSFANGSGANATCN